MLHVCTWLKRNPKSFTKMTFCWNFFSLFGRMSPRSSPKRRVAEIEHRVNKVGCGQLWKWWMLWHVLLSGSLAFLSIKLLIAIGEKKQQQQLDCIFLFLCWGVYELRMYELVLGKKEEWEQKIIEGLPHRGKLCEPVGVWYTEFGPQNTGEIIKINIIWNITNIWNNWFISFSSIFQPSCCGLIKVLMTVWEFVMRQSRLRDGLKQVMSNKMHYCLSGSRVGLII